MHHASKLVKFFPCKHCVVRWSSGYMQHALTSFVLDVNDNQMYALSQVTLLLQYCTLFLQMEDF